MTQVTISVVLGPRHSFSSHREKPSAPWDAPSSVIRLPNSAHTIKTHWWSRLVATRKKASIQPWAKLLQSTMI